jgi:hypothetical protein
VAYSADARRPALLAIRQNPQEALIKEPNIRWRLSERRLGCLRFESGGLWVCPLTRKPARQLSQERDNYYAYGDEDGKHPECNRIQNAKRRFHSRRYAFRDAASNLGMMPRHPVEPGKSRADILVAQQ